MEFPLLGLLLSHCGSSEPTKRSGGDTGGACGLDQHQDQQDPPSSGWGDGRHRPWGRSPALNIHIKPSVELNSFSKCRKTSHIPL